MFEKLFPNSHSLIKVSDIKCTDGVQTQDCDHICLMEKNAPETDLWFVVVLFMLLLERGNGSEPTCLDYSVVHLISCETLILKVTFYIIPLQKKSSRRMSITSGDVSTNNGLSSSVASSMRYSEISVADLRRPGLALHILINNIIKLVTNLHS